MKRITILGCAGAGKSTLAKKLSEKLDLPIIHLDQLYWDANWQIRDKQSFTADVKNAIRGEKWIMDGNYRSTIPERLALADTAIFLDFSSWRCVQRILTRTLKHYRQTRADMPEGCVERFDWEFTKYTWNFNTHNRPDIITILNQFKGRLITLRNPSEVDKFLSELQP